MPRKTTGHIIGPSQWPCLRSAFSLTQAMEHLQGWWAKEVTQYKGKTVLMPPTLEQIQILNYRHLNIIENLTYTFGLH